jgi:sigma-B regulation protein RsbU (phosphoserine phosphatase)
MVRERIRTAVQRLRLTARRTRDWLRVVMPHVAAAAAALFILKWLFGQTRLYGDNLIGGTLELVTFLVITFTTLYYCFKGLRWLKRRLLWRVRRRLVITYLFVGLTPIVLLGMLGFLFAISTSIADAPRTVTMHLEETKKRSLLSARALVLGFSRLPEDADDRRIKSWLDEQAALLQASLPGARVAVWRSSSSSSSNSSSRSATERVDAASTPDPDESPAQFISDSIGESSPASESSGVPVGAPLPEWLRARDEWSGFAYLPLPEEAPEYFAPTSIGALARGKTNGRALTVLLVMPVSRALVQQLRDTTGVQVHPFFIDPKKDQILNDSSRSEDIHLPNEGPGYTVDAEGNRVVIDEGGRRLVIDLKKDQLGDPLAGSPGPVFMTVTDWLTGEESQKVAFLFAWSFAAAGKQILGGGTVGRALMQVLIAVASFFLVLELLALISAAWMTRAVTGTVHRLYRATEFIKRGDFSHRVQVRSHDQLGELASAFNEMSANVESLLQERVKHERLEREVEIAAEVQAQLFPRRVPPLETVEVAAECRAARGVAGDYYDYIEVAPGLVAFALGDVSGKGLSASLVMSNLQASLRAQTTITAERLSIAEHALAVSTTDDGGAASERLRHARRAYTEMDSAVARKVTNINQQLCQSTEANRFATLVLALYEDRTRMLRYTNAGHNPPILVRADGTIERLTTGGMMAGAFEWAEYEEASLTLRDGDLLLIFSDGISEAENAAGEEYGEEKLIRFAVEHRTLSADEMRLAIFNEIDAWAGGRERGDDQTLVIIKSRSQKSEAGNQ